IPAATVVGRPGASASRPCPRSGGAQRGLHLAHDGGKAGLVVDRHVGEDLAVEADAGLVQAVDEGAVGDPVGTGRRIDAGDPERTEGPLARPTVTVGVLSGLHHRLDGDAIDVLATAAITLGGGQDLLVACARGDAAFDSRHVCVSLGVRHHGPDRRDVGRMDVDRATQLALVLGGLLREDVALERLPALDGTARADLEALGRASLGFHLGHIDPFSLLMPRQVPGPRPELQETRSACRGDQPLRLGASTITICRPSSRGMDSTWTMSSTSARSLSSSRTPSSWCAISRPRKRRVTLTLSPSSMNRTMLRSLTL